MIFTTPRLRRTERMFFGLIILFASGKMIAECNNNKDCQSGYVCKKKKCVKSKKNRPARNANSVSRGPRQAETVGQTPAGYQRIEPILVPKQVGSRPIHIVNENE